MLRLGRSLTLSLSLALLLIAVLPAAAQEGIPGSAPVRPQRTWTLPLKSNLASPAAQCMTARCVFLPLVQKPAPWIDTNARTASLAAYRQQYVVPTPIDPQWTGSYATCSPGDVSAELKAAILRRINYFRGMAGVPAGITFNSEYSRKAQAAALLLSVNQQMSFNPPSSWKCWSQDGADGSANSNLTLGGFGVDAIKGQMRSAGSYNGAVEPRRGILYPQTQQMGTGNVPAGAGNTRGAALWVFDGDRNVPRPQTRQTFAAWPPPGYVPYQVVFARWSFSYPDAYFDQATVNMTDPNGHPVPVSIAPADYDYGENTLVWTPFGMADDANWSKPTSDAVYKVMIGNVKIGLELRNFSYQVIVFDPDA